MCKYAPGILVIESIFYKFQRSLCEIKKGFDVMVQQGALCLAKREDLMCVLFMSRVIGDCDNRNCSAWLGLNHQMSSSAIVGCNLVVKSRTFLRLIRLAFFVCWAYSLFASLSTCL